MLFEADLPYHSSQLLTCPFSSQVNQICPEIFFYMLPILYLSQSHTLFQQYFIPGEDLNFFNPGGRAYGWNHPGSTFLLAECHQIMLTLQLLDSEMEMRLRLKMAELGQDLMELPQKTEVSFIQKI